MAIRMITSTRKRDRTSENYFKLKILKVNDLYYYNVAIFMHKYINDNLPSVFNEYFIKNSMIHERDTRNKEMLRIPLYKKSLGNLFIKNMGLKSGMN